MNSIDAVEVARTELGWTLFDPETGLSIGGPFETEGQATDFADGEGWVVVEG